MLIPPVITKEPSEASLTNHRRSKSDVSLPAIAPIIATVSRSNSDVKVNQKRNRGNGSFYPAGYQGTIHGLPRTKAYESNYQYKGNDYRMQDEYRLTNKNFYGFTHSIDRNKPRNSKPTYQKEEEPKEEKPKVVCISRVYK